LRGILARGPVSSLMASSSWKHFVEGIAFRSIGVLDLLYLVGLISNLMVS